MAQAISRIPLEYMDFEEDFGFSDDPAYFTDIAFGFWEEQDVSPESSCNSGDCNEEDEDEMSSCNVKENRKFWETEKQLLQATLYRTSSLETRIRQATKETLKEIDGVGMYCLCGKPMAGACRNCLQREVSNRLQNRGYNCAICKSSWKRSAEIPSGEHTFLEVVDKLDSKKGEVRVVIELNFRAEFEMAKANQEYNQLINRLPEVYVGKTERLKTLIKILCSAAKKCMEEKKMHLGPWRKLKYMQSKWAGTCEKSTPAPLPGGFSDRPAKSRASLLTCDLLETFPVWHCTAVQVL
ncbi:transcription factor bHLH [Salix suchowensis]|nr:transcription factor bHLH [Salix suchowensis]